MNYSGEILAALILQCIGAYQEISTQYPCTISENNGKITNAKIISPIS